MKLPDKIIKRNGLIVDFDPMKIELAIKKCFASLDEAPKSSVEAIQNSVLKLINTKIVGIPSVEDIQDMVELALLRAREYDASKRYILYREKHSQQREEVPDHIKDLFEIDAQYFPTTLQRFMFYDKYSRFNWDLGRRETWLETVDRSVTFLKQLSENKLDESIYNRIHDAILNMEVMPSMRLLAMAGPAAERNNMAIYNCSYVPVKDIEAFSEAMLISLAGCGVGFSVERNNIEHLPRVKRQTGEHVGHIYIEDSAEGWGQAVKDCMTIWWSGKDCDPYYDNLRKVGVPLKTKGGRASGPAPLKFVLDFLKQKILSRQGTLIRTIDAHDMMCVVGGAAVSGGVRRTAMIALFDYDDIEMRTCKEGSKLDQNPWRWNANNSAIWPDHLTQLELIEQFIEMYRNNRGEPGIFSRVNANNTKPSRRKKAIFGTNPCSEINLRPYEFCNLSIAVARRDDTEETLSNKVELATIIGTIQSIATKFPNMREEWQKNCIEERLLGVDITGQRDCLLLQPHHNGTIRKNLQVLAVETNKIYAEKLDINPSVAITCNKPSGNSSQFLDCSSGIHVRWAPFYIRNIRVNPYTPIFQVLKDAGVPMDPENGQSRQDATSWVIHFPVKSPEGAQTRKDVSAIDQCEFWLLNKLYWTEHNPSVTITYQPDELLPLTQWVWDHREVIGGMAFLPADDAQYSQMPYEEITEEEYVKLNREFPAVDFSRLFLYENDDQTTAAQEVACSSGVCEIDFSGIM